MNIKKTGYIAGAAAFFAAITVLSVLLIDRGSVWYEGLEKSPMQPPDMLSLAARPVLAAFLAASLAITLIKGDGAGSLPYAVTGVMCAFWHYIFFMAHSIAGALITAGALIIAAVWMFVSSAEKSGAAAWLTVPYIAWLAYGFALCFSTALLN